MATYKIIDLLTEDKTDKVLIVHYTITVGKETLSVTDTLEGDITTPYADLKEDTIIGWVKALPHHNEYIERITPQKKELPWATTPEIPEPTAEEKAAHEAIKYQYDREDAYGSIGEQLDMQYWDSVNGTTTWKDHIAKIKKDHPKPS